MTSNSSRAWNSDCLQGIELPSFFLPSIHNGSLTNPVTLSSISLSLRPSTSRSVLDARAFGPKILYHLVIPAFLCHILHVCVSFAEIQVPRPKFTVSGKDDRLSVQGFPKHNWCVRIVSFHRGISSCKKRPESGVLSVLVGLKE